MNDSALIKAFWSTLDKLISESEIVIDRPKGTIHPYFKNYIYEVDYGFLRNSTSMDGEGIDVWVGTDKKVGLDAIICTVDLLKRDSEIKLLIDCTEEEKEKIYQVHNRTKHMKGILIRKIASDY